MIMKSPWVFKINTHLTPKALNMNNPVQAEGAARGRENRWQYLNSVGVQHLSASCCAPTEHKVSTLHRPPRAAAIALHGVIHIARLRRATET